jgi:hypothetical protein
MSLIAVRIVQCQLLNAYYPDPARTTIHIVKQPQNQSYSITLISRQHANENPDHTMKTYKGLIKHNNLEEEQENVEDSNDNFDSIFNPRDIEITVETRSLDSIISRMRHGEIDLNTHFQRKGDLWPNKIMSRLIESVLIRFPLPAFYFDATDDNKWLIVDGLQRLSAIKKFVLNTETDFVQSTYTDEERRTGKNRPLRLTGLEYLRDCNGLTFDELPSTLKRRIHEAQITTYLVKPGTPEDVVYSVFYRINTGGLMLNPQEIRHALNQKGNAPKFLEELTSLDSFKQAVKITDKRMQDRELALRYIAFRMHSYKDYRPSMIRFLNKVMKELNSVPENKFRLLKSDFDRALDCAYRIFGENSFSKSISSREFKSSLNRTLFEVWTVTLSKMPQHSLHTLIKRKKRVQRLFVQLLREPDFDRTISISTTGSSQVEYRFKKIKQLLKQCI